MPVLTDFVTTARFNHEKNLLATKTENKIPDVSGLATASALTALENKIPDATNLVTKTDFDAKLKNISDRVTKNKSKDLLLDNELKKLKTFNTD